ncbi:MAG: hypothetical protein RR673_09295, partial [Erysipelotrichaceae bacterium]
DTIGSNNIIRNQTGSNFWPGQTIDYTISLGKDPATQTGTFPTFLYSQFKGTSWDLQVAAVKSAFAPNYTNIAFEEEVTTLTDDRPEFTVVYVSVDSGQENIPYNQKIIVKLLVKK